MTEPKHLIHSLPKTPVKTSTENLEEIQERHEKDEQEQVAERPDIKRALLYALGRLHKDNLMQIASSLTFTTVLAIVPLLSVILSLFTAFPIFVEFQAALEDFLINNLMPVTMADNIMSYLNTFAEQARKMTAVGAIFLMITSIMLMKTIDEALNSIWKVRKQRPLSKRILVYWALLSMGPIMLGASLWATSYITQAQFGLGVNYSFIQNILAALLPLLISTIGFTLMYFTVPNRTVQWRDAFIGGVAAAIVLELMKTGFAYYITTFPSYTLIYGTFAAIPIFLLWIYLSWLVVLLGASISAILPQLRLTDLDSHEQAGFDFVMSIHILRLLHQSRDDNPPGKSTAFIVNHLGVSPQHTTHLLDCLTSQGYIVNTEGKKSERWVLASSEQQSLQTLSDYFLFNQHLSQHFADERISQAMSRLVQGDTQIMLEDVL